MRSFALWYKDRRLFSPSHLLPLHGCTVHKIHCTNIVLVQLLTFVNEITCNIGAHSDIKKGKAVPLQAWSGPEGSRKLRFPDYTTTAQDGDKVVSLMHRPPLPP
jgi:hypothetical protein